MAYISNSVGLSNCLWTTCTQFGFPSSYNIIFIHVAFFYVDHLFWLGNRKMFWDGRLRERADHRLLIEWAAV